MKIYLVIEIKKMILLNYNIWKQQEEYFGNKKGNINS